MGPKRREGKEHCRYPWGQKRTTWKDKQTGKPKERNTQKESNPQNQKESEDQRIRLPYPELWIRIHWMNPVPDPAVQVNPDPIRIRIQGFDDKKNWRTKYIRNFSNLFLIKNCNLLMSKLRYRRSLQPSKENIQHFTRSFTILLVIFGHNGDCRWVVIQLSIAQKIITIKDYNCITASGS